MLVLTFPEEDLFDDANQEFIAQEDITLELEHSLVALSKWESIFQKPFLADNEKTDEEILAYIECMIVAADFPPDILTRLRQDQLIAVNDYINNKMTATWFNEPPNAPRSSEVITSELIYYWMFERGIPIECETWHLNRLMTLLKVFNLKQSKPKKMSADELRQRNRELNAKRKAQLGISG